MSNTRIKQWFNRFKEGSISVDSEPRHGRPSTSRNNVINQVRTLVMQDRRITVRELAEEVGVSIGTLHTILTADLGFRGVSAKFVPTLLTMEQKQLRLEIAQDLPDCVESDSNFLNTMITGDAVITMETFIIPEAKVSMAGPQQNQCFVESFSRLPWGGASRIHTRRRKRHKKVLRGVLCRLRNAVRRKRPVLRAAETWQLHHDNVPAHSSHLIQGFFG